MVKITGYDPNLRQISQKNANQAKPVDKAEFTKALKQAESAANSVNEVVSLSQADLQAVYGPPNVTAAQLAGQTDGLMAAERALDLLEAYQRALDDPGRSLKSIAPLVQGLEAEAGRLSGIADSLPSGNDLRTVLGDIASRAMIEAVKFNRGDYI